MVVGVTMNSTEFHCWRCGSDEICRSRSRNLLEKYLLPLFRLSPVRCANCYKRSYRFKFQPAPPQRTGSGTGMTKTA
jgi:hypothetical protein